MDATPYMHVTREHKRKQTGNTGALLELLRGLDIRDASEQEHLRILQAVLSLVEGCAQAEAFDRITTIIMYGRNCGQGER